MADTIDLAALVRGSKAQWDAFVRRYAGLILAAVRNQARDVGEVEDLAQEVFVRLCKDGYRLLKTYDPARAGLSTWLTIVARSTARDILRRRLPQTTPYEAVPESALAVTAEPTERIKLPEGLLSPRQQLILTMLYDRDMEVADVASALKVDPQTIRSTHHKAMLKLREHFAPENPAKSGSGRG
ncbi:MAG: sigma-70 family RNA polymerase sigma factor [Alphaproteobacteria bacterium]|nr:sigma-70 family RNA polymerase sigma factor [Alphaproteobacteria bacterium]MDE2514212.1 sigma-70 family RNA polymerase sigma factor [Alphaproteobacteria bacterium]